MTNDKTPIDAIAHQIAQEFRQKEQAMERKIEELESALTANEDERRLTIAQAVLKARANGSMKTPILDALIAGKVCSYKWSDQNMIDDEIIIDGVKIEPKTELHKYAAAEYLIGALYGLFTTTGDYTNPYLELSPAMLKAIK